MKGTNAMELRDIDVIKLFLALREDGEKIIGLSQPQADIFYRYVT
jgi:hypothetical protein